MDEKWFARVDDLISEAVDVREKGDPWGAIGIFNDVEDMVLERRNEVLKSAVSEEVQEELERIDVQLAVAFGHEIVCLKHVYEKHGDVKLLKDMEDICRDGLKLPIPRHHQAVFHLRMGDVYTLLGDYMEAYQAYAIACEWTQRGSLAEAEYLGHFAGALSNVGKHGAAIQAAAEALRKAEMFQLEEWHRLIIESGIYGRMAEAAWRDRSFGLAFSAFWQCFSMARRLKNEFKRPQRWNQLRARFF